MSDHSLLGIESQGHGLGLTRMVVRSVWPYSLIRGSFFLIRTVVGIVRYFWSMQWSLWVCLVPPLCRMICHLQFCSAVTLVNFHQWLILCACYRLPCRTECMTLCSLLCVLAGTAAEAWHSIRWVANWQEDHCRRIVVRYVHSSTVGWLQQQKGLRKTAEGAASILTYQLLS